MKYEIFALFCVVALTLSTGLTSGATAKLYDVDYRSPPEIEDLVLSQNVNNDTQQLSTTISEWQRDLGPGVMPNGTYWGTYFTGSKLQNYYQPSWYENIVAADPIWPTHDYLSSARYSYGLVAAHFNWTRQVLMNGASEWWIRTPLSPQSIEASNGLVMAVFKNRGTNASLVSLESSFQTNNTYMRPSIGGYIPDDYILFQFEQGNKGYPVWSMGYTYTYIDFISGYGRVANDRLYLKVNSILRPETDYIIALVWRMPPALGPTSSVFSYWTGPENVTGRWSHFEFAEYDVAYATPIYAEYESWNFTQMGNQSLDQPLDMDWSFIFTEGIGAGGLFGKTMTFASNGTLSLYPFVNLTRSGYQHMSFMLPFISPTNVTVEPEIHQAYYFPAFSPAHMWTFNDGLPYFDPNIWYNYTDFILFSSSGNINFSGSYYFNQYDHWNVKVELNFMGSPPNYNATRYYNVTLLCYERTRPAKLWTSLVETSPYSFNTSWNPWLRPHLSVLGDATYDSYSPDGGHLSPRGYEEYLYYEVYMSARGTDGQWVMKTGSLSGNPILTFHFPQIIWISPMEWRLTKGASQEIIRLSQEDGYYAQVQDWWGEHHFGEAIRTKFYSEAAAKGGGDGIIHDGLSNLMNAFIEFGKWLYIIAVSFVGQLIKFIGEVLDAITAIVIYLAWLVAPAGFMLEVGWAAKYSKRLTHVKGEEDV